MNGLIKFLIFLVSGFGFWLLTGDGSEAVLLIILLMLLKYKESEEDSYGN